MDNSEPVEQRRAFDNQVFVIRECFREAKVYEETRGGHARKKTSAARRAASHRLNTWSVVVTTL